MPHLFIPLRPRKYALGAQFTKGHPIVGFLSSNKFWAYFNTYTYLVGGFMFIVGSFYFTPHLSDKEAVGCWIFIVASAFWLVVSMHDAAELSYHQGKLILIRPDIDGFAAVSYIGGSILFILGSIFFLPTVGLYSAGAYSFIFGSLLFVIGAILNGLQIFDATTKRDAQYMLMTAMFYVVGSVMFLVTSIPYLFSFDSTSDETKIDAFLAGIYIGGSICFTVGGIINYHRYAGLRKRVEGQLNESLLEDNGDPNKSWIH